MARDVVAHDVAAHRMSEDEVGKASRRVSQHIGAHAMDVLYEMVSPVAGVKLAP